MQLIYQYFTLQSVQISLFTNISPIKILPCTVSEVLVKPVYNSIHTLNGIAETVTKTVHPPSHNYMHYNSPHTIKVLLIKSGKSNHVIPHWMHQITEVKRSNIGLLLGCHINIVDHLRVILEACRVTIYCALYSDVRSEVNKIHTRWTYTYHIATYKFSGDAIFAHFVIFKNLLAKELASINWRIHMNGCVWYLQLMVSFELDWPAVPAEEALWFILCIWPQYGFWYIKCNFSYEYYVLTLDSTYRNEEIR